MEHISDYMVVVVDETEKLRKAAPVNPLISTVEILDLVHDTYTQGVLTERSIKMLPVVNGTTLVGARVIMTVFVATNDSTGRPAFGVYFKVSSGQASIIYEPIGDQTISDVIIEKLPLLMTDDVREKLWKSTIRELRSNREIETIRERLAEAEAVDIDGDEVAAKPEDENEGTEGDTGDGSGDVPSEARTTDGGLGDDAGGCEGVSDEGTDSDDRDGDG